MTTNLARARRPTSSGYELVSAQHHLHRQHCEWGCRLCAGHKPEWCQQQAGPQQRVGARRQPPPTADRQAALGNTMSRSRSMTFVVTRPPASRQILAATLSKGHPRLPSTPACAHAARWWPLESSGRLHRQERTVKAPVAQAAIHVPNRTTEALQSLPSHVSLPDWRLPMLVTIIPLPNVAPSKLPLRDVWPESWQNIGPTGPTSGHLRTLCAP